MIPKMISAVMTLALVPAAMAQSANNYQQPPVASPSAIKDGTANPSAQVRPDAPASRDLSPVSGETRNVVANSAPAGNPRDAAAPQATEREPSVSPEIILHDGTPVRIRLSRTLSSEQVKTGDQIDFDVLDDISVGNRVVISRGAKAIGAITDAEHKRRMGRGGKLNFVLDYLRLTDGTKVSLRAEHDTRGGGHVGAMSAGIATAVVFGFGLPAPLFLLMHGKEAVVPQGTELTAYVNGDTRLSLEAFSTTSR